MSYLACCWMQSWSELRWFYVPGARLFCRCRRRGAGVFMIPGRWRATATTDSYSRKYWQGATFQASGLTQDPRKSPALDISTITFQWWSTRFLHEANVSSWCAMRARCWAGVATPAQYRAASHRTSGFCFQSSTASLTQPRWSWKIGISNTCPHPDAS